MFYVMVMENSPIVGIGQLTALYGERESNTGSGWWQVFPRATEPEARKSWAVFNHMYIAAIPLSKHCLRLDKSYDMLKATNNPSYGK